MTEHTCGGFYDLTCEACQELRDAMRDELPGEGEYHGWLYDEPIEWDVVGGL